MATEMQRCRGITIVAVVAITSVVAEPVPEQQPRSQGR